MHIFCLIRNLRIENSGPLGFSCDFVLQCTWKKCITIYVLLGNIRPRLGTVRCRFFGGSRGLAPSTSTRTPPWKCWGGTQMYCAMTDGHCMLSDQEGKSMTWGAINRAASPAASLSPRHCSVYLNYTHFHQTEHSSCFPSTGVPRNCT